jgi:hypothetical protein
MSEPIQKQCPMCGEMKPFDPGLVTDFKIRLPNWRAVRNFPEGVCPDCFEKVKPTLPGFMIGYQRPEIETPQLEYDGFRHWCLRYGFDLFTPKSTDHD